MQIKDMFAKPIDREIQGVVMVGQGESTDPEDWIGIATSQEGVDIDGMLMDDGSWKFKWLGQFYIPEEDGKTLDPDSPVNLCFSVHDEDYTEEIYSPTITLERGGDFTL